MSGRLDPATYDAWFDQPWGSHAFNVERDTLLGALGPLEGRRLLDVGCGTGRFAAAFEAAGAHVVGLDRDPGMLGLAHQRTSARLLVGDAHQLPIDDDSFDVAVATPLLEFASDPHDVLDELVRTRASPRSRPVLHPPSAAGLAMRTNQPNTPALQARLPEPPAVVLVPPSPCRTEPSPTTPASTGQSGSPAAGTVQPSSRRSRPVKTARRRPSRDRDDDVREPSESRPGRTSLPSVVHAPWWTDGPGLGTAELHLRDRPGSRDQRCLDSSRTGRHDDLRRVRTVIGPEADDGSDEDGRCPRSLER